LFKKPEAVRAGIRGLIGGVGDRGELGGEKAKKRGSKNLPRSGLLEHINQPDRQKTSFLAVRLFQTFGHEEE
jgi:hypothetical protein